MGSTEALRTHQDCQECRLAPAQAETLVALSENSGWNQVAADWRFMLAQGRGFGFTDPSGRPVASAIHWPVGDRLDWISMVLTHTQFRKRGFGTLLVRSSVLREVDGWRGVPRGVDVALIDDVASAGGVIWRTHPFGYLLRRSTGQHTWNVDESYFERQAEQRWDGLALDVAGVCEVGGPPAG